MKRVIGSFAALILALTLGVAAYGKVPRQQNSNNQTTAPVTKTSNKKMRHNKTRRSSHQKTHRTKKAKKQVKQ